MGWHDLFDVLAALFVAVALYAMVYDAYNQ